MSSKTFPNNATRYFVKWLIFSQLIVWDRLLKCDVQSYQYCCFFLRRLGVPQTQTVIGKRLWFPFSTTSKFHTHFQNHPFLTSPLTLLIHLKIHTLYYSFAERQRLPVKFEWQNYGQRKRSKQNNVRNKTSLSSSIIFSSSPWPFQKQDKDYFKWSVQNDKHQLVVLAVSFGESLYLKEVTH